MIIKKMADDGYVKIGDNVWTDAKKRVRIEFTEDKANNRCISEATQTDDTPGKD
jgi:hypothetical protein